VAVIEDCVVGMPTGLMMRSPMPPTDPPRAAASRPPQWKRFCPPKYGESNARSHLEITDDIAVLNLGDDENRFHGGPRGGGAWRRWVALGDAESDRGQSDDAVLDHGHRCGSHLRSHMAIDSRISRSTKVGVEPAEFGLYFGGVRHRSVPTRVVMSHSRADDGYCSPEDGGRIGGGYDGTGGVVFGRRRSAVATPRSVGRRAPRRGRPTRTGTRTRDRSRRWRYRQRSDTARMVTALDTALDGEFFGRVEHRVAVVHLWPGHDPPR